MILALTIVIGMVIGLALGIALADLTWLISDWWESRSRQQ